MTSDNPYPVNPSNYMFQSFLSPWAPYVNARPMIMETLPSFPSFPSFPYFNIFIQPIQAQPNNFYPSNYYQPSVPCRPIQLTQIALVAQNQISPVAISVAQNTPEVQKVIEISDDDLPVPEKSKSSTRELSQQKCVSTAGPLRAKVEYKKSNEISNQLRRFHRISSKKKRRTIEVKTRPIVKPPKKMKISQCRAAQPEKKMRKMAKLRDQRPEILIGPQFQAVLPKCMLHSQGAVSIYVALLEWKQSRLEDLLSRRIR